MSKYDTDIAAWSEEQAAALRQRASNALDWENLAEEIEAVGVSQKKEIRSRLAVLCQHLLKWKHQPGDRSRSWRATIKVQRDELIEVLQENPSLRPVYAGEALARAFLKGRDKAEEETGLFHLPAACPWTIDEVLDPEFWPGGRELN